MSTNSRSETVSDEVLMLSASEGDDVAYNALYTRYARRLCGFFVRMLACSIDESKDYVQELFIRVYEHRQHYNGESFTAWLYSIAYNICKNELRRREVRKRFDSLYSEEETEEQPLPQDTEFLTRMLHNAIDRLPQAHREVFILRYIEERSTAEVAQITGTPEGTVKSRLHYALAAVKEKMKKYNF